MSPKYSENLDMIRGLAALSVFAAHYSSLGYAGPYSGFLMTLGHDGVVVFFVLSGLVIAWITQTKYSNLKEYSLARVSRLSSVVLPAVLLTVPLDMLGNSFSPELYQAFPYDRPLLRIILNALYLNETWLHVRLFSNGPLWSVSYEFWYYAIFGVWFFLRGWKRYLATAITILIAGPLILVMAPVWLLGVLAYHAIKDPKTSQFFDKIPLLLFALVIAFLFIAEPFKGADVALRDAMTGGHGERLAFSGHLVSDYLKGIFVAGFLIRLASIEKTATGWAKHVSVWLASFSFTLYALHMPIVICLRALDLYDPYSWIQSILAGIAIIVLCWGLSFITERQRYRLRSWLNTWVAALPLPDSTQKEKTTPAK
jgi:peptidoglycan/LPS O-acetylase OafA/YrhL